MDDVSQLQPGQVLGKDFRVLKPLASGGMGSVYLVEQLSTGRERALKVMHPQFVKSDESRERFTQEAKVGARIRSDHVVDVVTAGVDDATGIPYLAMELLDGEELSRRVHRRKHLPPQEVLEIFRQLCHALGEAHRANLVHRDLKPQNLFIARARRPGDQFTVKILDFGVAKLVQELDGQSADTTKPVGTPRWMAPEQSDQGANIRPATDVWALGLIAFHALTGKYFWKAANVSLTNLQALLREVIVEPIGTASERARSLGVPPELIPPGFDAWFARCVVREQSQRFADATEAFEALSAVLSDKPLPAVKAAGPLEDITLPEPVVLDAAGGTQQFPSSAALRPVPEKPATDPHQTPSQATIPVPAPSHAPMYVAVAIGTLALIVAGVALRRAPPKAAPVVPAAPVVQQALPDSFTVIFDSFPSGATVFEGATALGTTPLQLPVKNAPLEKEPRRFRIERPGFLPYSIVQGPSRDPVRVLATLTPAPSEAKPVEEAPQEEKQQPRPEEKPKRRVDTEEEPELRLRR